MESFKTQPLKSRVPDSGARRLEERTPDKKRVRALIVEDSPEDAFLLQLQLTQHTWASYGIAFATTLREALDVLEAQDFDLVIADLNLPDSLAMTTVRSLRLATEAPLIVHTGEGSVLIGEESLRCGADDFLEKGAPQDTISRILRFALSRRSTDRDTRMILDHCSETLLISRESGGVVFANDAARRLLGPSVSELPAAWEVSVGADWCSLEKIELKRVAITWNHRPAILTIAKNHQE